MTETGVQERDLFVSWRAPSGSIRPVGLLRRQRTSEGDRFTFVYLKLAEHFAEFEPLPGLPDLHRRYESEHLFPVFANRMMPRSRPEYDALAASVDLPGEGDPFEVLARSGGRRATDRIEVFLPPERRADGSSCVLFFARGIRHVDGAAAAVDALQVGDRLQLVDDRSNAYNSRAIILRVRDGHPVGWVPDYLVEHVHDLRQLNGTEPTIEVAHVNEGTVAPHLRLLCRLTAPWPDGYEPFSDADFQPLA